LAEKYQQMNWFFGATTGSPQIENKEVEETLQKISNSTLLEDRIDAIQKLSELSSDETKHSKFGEESVKIVFEQLKIQHENVEIVKQLLLVVLNLEKVLNFFLNSSERNFHQKFIEIRVHPRNCHFIGFK
jgi:hypothetical protein